MRVTPVEALHRFLDLPRKTEQRHLEQQQQGEPAVSEFALKLCATIAERETTTVYTADGKLRNL